MLRPLPAAVAALLLVAALPPTPATALDTRPVGPGTRDDGAGSRPGPAPNRAAENRPQREGTAAPDREDPDQDRAAFDPAGTGQPDTGPPSPEPADPGRAAPRGPADIDPAGPLAGFGEVITVALSSFPVRVVDRRGEPVRGLTAESFLVTSGDVRIPVVAVDWVEAGEAWAAPAGAPPPGPAPFELPETAAREDSGGEPLPPPPPGAASPVGPGDLPPPGRLVVLFVQSDFNAPRIYGHLKMLPRIRQVLDSLSPRDRVAVVSFDSHLKLWQDFTADRDVAHRAVERAVRFGADPPTGVRPSRHAEGPSLAAALEPRALREAAWVEEGLELVGRALGAVEGGEKVLIFVGWGLGEYGANGFRMRGEYRPAREALQRAGVTVFAFDVMDAAAHDLELGLKRVAADTGGVYYRTATNPILATERLIRTLSGHYVVTVDAGALPPPGSPVDVQLVGVEAGARLHLQPLRVGR